MMTYGFQRLVLLGSAGYQRAELPLDAAVSLIAPNNTGKTSLINALQFLLIIDTRRMDFGSHELSKSRRFYFPNNSSYILLEVLLPQSGTVVLGCVGKGVGHDYEYFAYKGELKTEDYRLPNGALVQQPQLIEHLASKGGSVSRYDAREFAKLVYGGNSSRRSDTDFTLFRLEKASDAKTFQEVLTRTLRLDKLSSSKVKEYLQKIFQHDLINAQVDFKQEWDKAFHEVNLDRDQYQSACKAQARVAAAAEQVEQRLRLRGQLLALRPHVDAGLEAWHGHYQTQQQLLQERLDELKQQADVARERDHQLVRDQTKLEREQQELHQLQQQQDALANRFALTPNRRLLQQQLEQAQQQLEAVVSQLQQSEQRTPTAIKTELERQQHHIDGLSNQLANIDDNLYRQLEAQIDTTDLVRLNKLLNHEVLSLAPTHFRVNLTELKQTLVKGQADQLHLAGLEVSLASLKPQYQELSKAELQEQLDDGKHRLTALQDLLVVAKSLEQTRQKKADLAAEVKSIEKDLADFDEWQQLLLEESQRSQRLQALHSEIDAIRDTLANAQQLAEQLNAQLDDTRQQQQRLEHDQRTISQLRDKRLDQAPIFTQLADLPHHPWLTPIDWPLDVLAEQLQTYTHACKQLLQLDAELRTGLAELHADGLTKYMDSTSDDVEWQRIIAFCQQLDKEQEALEKKARSAVVNVTASLRELREGLSSFQKCMHDFNRLISKRQLSDLAVFKIDAVDEAALVEAIDLLIHTAEQVESGDNFVLFNQQSMLDDKQLARAKQYLIDEGNARHGLKVGDLFRLEFKVGKTQQEVESFEDIDSAASNGTVLMAKLVTGLAMLYQMQDKRSPFRAICYLDEALALDSKNQKSLVATAAEFGYALIFASPAPLTCARYCVPIHQHNGKNHISRESWQEFEPLDVSITP
jgi:hypothetical protein